MKISTFNCKGFKFRNHDFFKLLFSEVDILLLQEIWLYEFQFDELKKVFPGCEYCAVTPMDNKDISYLGRPYGGCSIVWKQSKHTSIKS